MTGPPLAVALVWHMHQPYYRDDVAGLFMLPWVRRRATKDYLHMLRLLERHPDVRVTMNVVPSLLQQLELYAEGKIADADRDLCLRDAVDLTPAERSFLVVSALRNDHGRRVSLLAPMMSLLSGLRDRDPTTVEAGELRDLQLWTLLAWIDSEDILADPALRALAERGSGFSEDDKVLVDTRQLALLGEVIPRYRAACARGQVEPMTTPLQHPILPLLIDQVSALVAAPAIDLPDPPLQAAADGELQVRRGREEFRRITGVDAAGMWPAECAVSPAAADLMHRCGVRFAVSDEGVLSRTLGPDADVRADGSLYSAHADVGGLLMVFRDAELSNRIGFSYQSTDAGTAADDLIARLETIAEAGGDGPPRLVTLALDGENFKDFYAENGTPFLDALYTRLVASPALTTSFIGTFLDDHPEAVRPLPELWTGSWIDADLRTWIGDAAHNRAWTLVGRARDALLAIGGEVSQPAAFAELMIAEASDWFWWFGARHDSGSDAAWDALFRTHLRNAYTLAGLAVPDGVDEPILDSAPLPRTCAPLRSIDPTAGGDAEWQAGGGAEVGDVFGAMRPPASSVGWIRYGAGGGRLHLLFGAGTPRFERAVVDAGPVGRLVITQPTRTLSVTVPAGGAIEFSITLEESGRGRERVPLTGTLRVVMSEGAPPLRVVLAAAECAPLAEVGSLAATVADTAREAAALGHDVVVVIPHHRGAGLGVRPGVRIDRLTARTGGQEVSASVLQGCLPGSSIPVLSIDAPAFFDRDSIYGCGDDGDRYLAFCALAAVLVDATCFAPDIVHGFEWQTAALVARVAAGGDGAATVFSSAAGSTGYLVDGEQAAGAGIPGAGMDELDLLEVGRHAAAALDTRVGHAGLDGVYERALRRP
jgi:alpha-amylase/alpha-mannosidase (GH57 family)